MTRFLPGATSFKSWSSVRFEIILFALSKTSRHELIATCTDNWCDVTVITPLFRSMSIACVAPGARSSLWRRRARGLSNGHRRRGFLTKEPPSPGLKFRSSVDRDTRSCDPARRVRRQERDHVCDIFRLADSL